MSGDTTAYRASGNGRRLKMFQPISRGPNSALLGMPTLLARARHQARNDPWAASAISKSVSNGIAPGIQAKPLWGSDEFKKAAHRLWNRWMKRSDADGGAGRRAVERVGRRG